MLGEDCFQCELVRFARLHDTCSVCKEGFELETPRLTDSPSLDPRKHLYWEVAAIVDLGRSLDKYEAAPGCPCVRCTGIIPMESGPLPEYDDTLVKLARQKSLLEVLERVGARPHKKGSHWKAYCVLHDDRNPSLSVNMKRGVWYCFVCQTGGDGIKLLMDAEALSFQDAVRSLQGG